MTYEALVKKYGARLEKIEQDIQMLSPRDCGKPTYIKIMARYNALNNGDEQAIEEVAGYLHIITGFRY